MWVGNNGFENQTFKARNQTQYGVTFRGHSC